MKAIYINLDPYLQAVANWINAGKPGTVPCFNPLPLAVTIPLGESACIYLPATGSSADSEPDYNSATIDGQTIQFMFENSGAFPEGTIAYGETPGLSALAPSAKYAVAPVTGDTSLKVLLSDGDTYDGSVTIPVLVRRETTSGPVDLVDFTPPVDTTALDFTGADIKGAEFDGNEIEAAADTGVLSAPAAGG